MLAGLEKGHATIVGPWRWVSTDLQYVHLQQQTFWAKKNLSSFKNSLSTSPKFADLVVAACCCMLISAVALSLLDTTSADQTFFTGYPLK